MQRSKCVSQNASETNGRPTNPYQMVTSRLVVAWSVDRWLTLCTKERNASASSISSGWRDKGDLGASSRAAAAATTCLGGVFGFFRRTGAAAGAAADDEYSLAATALVAWVDRVGACKMCSGWNRTLGRGKMPTRGSASALVDTSDSVSTRANWLGCVDPYCIALLLLPFCAAAATADAQQLSIIVVVGGGATRLGVSGSRGEFGGSKTFEKFGTGGDR